MPHLPLRLAASAPILAVRGTLMVPIPGPFTRSTFGRPDGRRPVEAPKQAGIEP